MALMYLVEVDPCEGQLVAARLVPLKIWRFRLIRASAADAKWLCDLLNRFGRPLGTQVELGSDNSITLRWQ